MSIIYRHVYVVVSFSTCCFPSRIFFFLIGFDRERLLPGGVCRGSGVRRSNILVVRVVCVDEWRHRKKWTDCFFVSHSSLAWKNSLCVRMAGLKNRVQSSWRVENFPSSLTPKLLALIYVRVCVCVFCFRELSNLRKREDYYTNCFAEVQRCWCVQGRYPTRLISLWKEYDQTKGTWFIFYCYCSA